MIERSKNFPTVSGYEYAYDPERPYDICIGCAYINSASCDGPNFFSMTPERRCEWLQSRRHFLKMRDPHKWSYDYLAETADVAKNTVIRVFSDPTYDPRVSTLERILKIMVNGSWGQNPCALMSQNGPEIVYTDTPETIRQLNEKIEQLTAVQDTLKNIHDSYATEMNAIRAKAEQIAEYLKSEIAKRDETIATKDKIIAKMVLGE